jgi:uncharacterized protein (TIGR03435 family)
LTWILHRNIVRTAEEISDDDAIRTTRDRVAYAEILLDFMRRGVGRVSLPGIPMARYERPEARIRRILNFTAVSRAANYWGIAAILTLSAPLAYFAAAADPLSTPQSAPQSSPKPALSGNPPEFEVASIRPAPPEPPPRPDGAVVIRVGFRWMPGGGLRASNISLVELIAHAYRIDCHDECRDFISGGQEWMSSARFDIQARAPQPEERLDHLTTGQRTKQGNQLARQRLQALLADRFQLVLRNETNEGQTYALRILKSGHKLQPGTGESSVQGGDSGLTARNTSMEGLAAELTSLVVRPVSDKTGLTGGFNFKLDWSALSPFRGEDVQDVSGHSIFGALQSQLGLRLERSKGPVTKLVVVRAERPSETDRCREALVVNSLARIKRPSR